MVISFCSLVGCLCLGLGGLDAVRITEVKGHADECMVRDGGVRELDRLGNNAADEAADFGRRMVDLAVIDARRNFAGVWGWWYPVILVLLRQKSPTKQKKLLHTSYDMVFWGFSLGHVFGRD